MANWNFNYAFNITGNASSAVQKIAGDVTALNGKVNEAAGVWDSFAGKLVMFNQITQYVEGFARTVDSTLAPGAALNASLKDLQAITDVSGEGLKMIEGYARQTAKTFGGPAAQSVESYKLLLGQLTPELAKSPEALKAMGESVATLSKTMGGDATAATEVLTTAMNQYGVSLDDPMEASRRMADMMNVMAAAGKEGSAELPAIKVALEQCGMAAKGAGVSFEETNAAIQVLDKAGKKGAEGGVALRNVMTTLSKGRFLPKVVLEELRAAGVDVQTLTDKSLSLADRLTPLKGVMNDTALFTKLFGMENANAGRALVQGIDDVRSYTEAISGTNTAYEQAAIVMESYNERKARVQARFQDFQIAVFNATGDFGIWVSTIAGALVPVSQLVPLVTGLGSAMSWVKSLNFAPMMSAVARAFQVAKYQLLFLNAELRTGQMASLGFAGNVLRASIAVVRFATVGILQGLKALGSWILSCVTGGAASATFAATASTSFAAFKLSAVTACRAVGIAIMNIPIVGWIAVAIAALVALGIYFWKTSATFRAVLKGMAAVFVAYFKGIWDLAKNVFGALSDLFIAAFKFDGKGMKEAMGRLKGGFVDFGTNLGTAFSKAYNAEMDKSKAEEDAKKKAEEEAKKKGLDITGMSPEEVKELLANTTGKEGDTADAGSPIAQGLQGIGGGSGGDNSSSKIKNISVNIEQLVGRFEIHTTNLREDASKIKEMVAEALVAAVNDVNYAI